MWIEWYLIAISEREFWLNWIVNWFDWADWNVICKLNVIFSNFDVPFEDGGMDFWSLSYFHASCKNQ